MSLFYLLKVTFLILHNFESFFLFQVVWILVIFKLSYHVLDRRFVLFYLLLFWSGSDSTKFSFKMVTVFNCLLTWYLTRSRFYPFPFYTQETNKIFRFYWIWIFSLFLLNSFFLIWGQTLYWLQYILTVHCYDIFYHHLSWSLHNFMTLYCRTISV